MLNLCSPTIVESKRKVTTSNPKLNLRKVILPLTEKPLQYEAQNFHFPLFSFTFSTIK
jgi:hypothetical protein